MSFLKSFLQALLYPLSLSFGFVNRIFLYFSTWSPTSRRFLANDPASVADRWVRGLEEETGAIRESRVADVIGMSSSADAQAGPGPSTLSRRTSSSMTYRKHIPEFFLGSYEQALKLAQKEMRPLCVIIVSEEHDDVPDFKRTTLLDTELNEILKKNDFVVWGGDVRDYEAHQAAQKLGTTTYPFVAFVGLQPASGSRNSNSSPFLAVLSRHQGPALPSVTDVPISELGPTSARALCEHLNSSLLPRVKPFLDRLRNVHEERLRERRLREEQDAAFALAAQRDKERISAKIAEERKQREEIEMQERKKATEEAEKQRRLEEKTAKEANRLHWYRYARRSMLSPEPASAKDNIRVGVRLPDGRRQIRQFLPADSVTSLYIFVASQLISKELLASDDPSTPPLGFAPGEAGVNEDCWSFRLASSFPRKEIPWVAGKQLSSVDGLKGGAQLVVESIPGHTLIPGSEDKRQGDDSDYDTEEE